MRKITSLGVFINGKRIMRNSIVKVKVTDEGCFPVMPLNGVNKREVVTFTDKGVYLLDAKFVVESNEYFIVGVFRDFVSDGHKKEGSTVEKDLENKRFVIGSNNKEVTHARLVTVFCDKVKVILF